jgi:hypothetical protein
MSLEEYDKSAGQRRALRGASAANPGSDHRMITGPNRKVRDLEDRRVERLADELAPELRNTGQLLVHVQELENVERWRRAVRRAARHLGWHVRTGVSGKVAWAVADDWSKDDPDLATLRLVTTAIPDLPPKRKG